MRLAVRAVLVEAGRLLLVNAWPGQDSDLWCAPGGGAEPGASLPDNLVREVREETGMRIAVGAPCLVNEFHDPGRGFHQVEVFFRARLAAGAGQAAPPGWRDPEGVVNRMAWVTRDEVARLRLKPDSLPRVAWEAGDGVAYDPLERLQG